MAQSVKAHHRKTCACLGLLLALGFLTSGTFAENLPDPTRPSGGAYSNEGAVTKTRVPVLQSVLTSSGRKLAIIDGQTVKQGDMIGNARVLRIGEAEVMLAQGKQTQVLKLFPVLEKRPSTIRPQPSSGTRQW